MSLRVWLPLNGTLDNLGYSNIAITNNGTTVNTSGKIGSCYSFNGTNNYLSLSPAVFDNSVTEFSFACWFKPTNSHNGCLFSNRTLANTTGITIFYYSNQFIFDCYDRWQFTPSTAIKIGEWNHIVCTYKKGEKKKFYLNGIATDSANASSSAPTTATASFASIGASQLSASTVNGNWFNGALNDVRIYDHCLSAAEVREISQGLVLHYKLDGFFGGAGENLVINGNARNGLTGWSNWGTASSRQVITIGTKKWFNFKTDPNGNYGGFSQDRGIALYKPNTQYTISALMYASANASGRLWVHTRSTEGGANLAQYLTTVNVTTSPALYTFTFNTGSNASYTINKLNLMIGAVSTTSALDFYISNIKVEEGTKATTWVPCKEEGGYDTTKVEDSSGYGHSGSILNAPTISSDTSRYSNSLNFNGTTDGILIENLPLSNIINTEVTYSFWIKPNGENGARSVYFGSYSGASWSIEKNTSNVLRSYWNGSPDESCSGATITDGIWQHICVTKKGTSDIKAYINGVQKWNSTATHNNLTLPTTYRIGRDTRSSDGTPYKGQMSDFRIYCTALSADDILQLYHTGAKVDNKQNLHTFEYIEGQTATKLTKQGQFKCDEIVESTAAKIKKDKTIEAYEFIEL